VPPKIERFWVVFPLLNEHLLEGRAAALLDQLGGIAMDFAHDSARTCGDDDRHSVLLRPFLHAQRPGSGREQQNGLGPLLRARP
jgi:hypothetical protein